MDNAYPAEPSNRLPWYFWLFIIIAAIASLLIAAYFIAPSLFKKGFSFLNGKPTPTPTNAWTPHNPTPIPIGGGKQIYRISGGTKGAPQITDVTLDPIDPKIGSSQTMEVKVNDTQPVKELTVVYFTDGNKSKTYSLTLANGTNTDGIWKSTWKMENSYDYIYRIVLKAKNEAGLIGSITLTIR